MNHKIIENLEYNLESLHRKLLSWDLSESLALTKDGIEGVSGDESVHPIPDRFLQPSEYIMAFASPAFLEIKASVLHNIQTETIPSCEVSVSVLRAEQIRKTPADFTELQVRFVQQSEKTKVSSKREFPQLPADSLCVITPGTSVAEGPCVLGLVRPTRTQGGVLLKVMTSRLGVMGQNDQSLLLHLVGSLISPSREMEAMCSMKSIRLRDEILLGIETAEEGPISALSYSIPPALTQHFESRLNTAQQRVIESVCGLSSKYKPRIVLVRGPPGSGKTMTLNAVLNAQHVQQFNAYYGSIVETLKAGRMTTSERSWLDLASVAKPRIIVCAPSNVAIDNIILRILSDQFVGGDGNKYTPWLVRIGKGSTQNQEVAKKALSRMVDELMNTNGTELVSQISKLESLYSELRQGVILEVARLQCMIAGTPHAFRKGIETRVMVNGDGMFVPYWVDHEAATSLTEMPPAATGETCAPLEQMQEWLLYSKELTRQLELWEAVHWELQRYRLVRSYIQDSVGVANSAAAMAEKFQLQANLETLLMNQASIVCGTLNSTALAQVKQSIEFQTCVVDEAAQAVELSTLIPLQLGVKQLVLVGDPQQLPATVIGKRELVGNYERSLFERLEHCGLPVHTLDVQYRMHPAISVFPRNQFYQGVLKDADSVAHISPIFSRPPYNLNPFVFVDVLAGRDVKSQQSLSRSNSEEAAVCVSLYFALLRMSQEQGLGLNGSVGIISPYAEQVKLLKQTFEAAGVRVSGHLDDIEIATVDSFQGKEKDIIILSTVRGCPESNSVGFLADVRRMNVALTRAKQGLFVVGKTQTLQTNQIWNSLIKHARQTRNSYVQVRGPGDDMYGVFAASFFGNSSRGA